MSDVELAIWLLFILTFIVLPIKPFFRYLFKLLRNGGQDTTPCVDEEGYHERHYAQLYRPGDKKYNRIVELSNRAKSVN
jgi:hypothetical protein